MWNFICYSIKKLHRAYIQCLTYNCYCSLGQYGFTPLVTVIPSSKIAFALVITF